MDSFPHSFTKGATSQRVAFPIGNSATTDGSGNTALAFNTPSMACYFWRDGDTAPTAISLASGTLGTWSSGGFKIIDSVNMPGMYEFGIPNACLVTGSKSCKIMFKGVTGMRPTILDIRLTGTDDQDAATGGITDIAAIKVKTDLITAGSVAITGPVDVSVPSITMIRGDDYKAADGRAIIFSSTDWPSVVAATVTLRVNGLYDYAYTVTNATTVTRDFTAAETAKYPPGTYNFQLLAVLSNGDTVTLAEGLQANGAGLIIVTDIPPA